jgi:hypothetical protein
MTISPIGRTCSTASGWGHSSVGRAPALQAGGRRFDPVWLHQHFECSCQRAKFTRAGNAAFRAIFYIVKRGLT